MDQLKEPQSDATRQQSKKKDKATKPSKTFLSLFFFAQGVVALSGFFVFLSELDYFQSRYKDSLFYFWSIVPGNIAVPVSF